MKRVVLFLLISVLTTGVWLENVSGMELEELELTEINDLSEEKNISFKDVAELIFAGDFNGTVALIYRAFLDNFFSGEIIRFELLKELVITGICSGLLLTFMKNEKRETTNISEMVTKITVITLVQTFSLGLWDIVNEVLDFIISFMEALLPTMVVTLAACGKSITSIAFYETVMIIIAVMEKLSKGLIFPLISLIMYINIANYVSKEKMFGTLSGLLFDLVNMINKVMLMAVLGFNVVKALICPVSDSIKMSAFEKCISMLPGVGNVAQAVSGVIVGTGLLLRNTIGITACIVLVISLLGPVLKIYLSSYAIKAAGGLFEVISDKSYVEYLNTFSNSLVLLASTLCYIVFMFIITIGLVCASFK